MLSSYSRRHWPSCEDRGRIPRFSLHSGLCSHVLLAVCDAKERFRAREENERGVFTRGVASHGYQPSIPSPYGESTSEYPPKNGHLCNYETGSCGRLGSIKFGKTSISGASLPNNGKFQNPGSWCCTWGWDPKRWSNWVQFRAHCPTSCLRFDDCEQNACLDF